MRVLLTNDDGPLNDEFSPYIRPFVQHIKKNYPDWELTICIPDRQRSWIGKAHFAGKSLNAQFLYSKPDADDNSYLGPFIRPQLDSVDSKLPRDTKNSDVSKDDIEWILIDGTPASCVNIGLYHLNSKSFDLVISGPNVGRNTSSAYISSSGTVGAAMESVITGNTKAIAVSFAYFNGEKHVDSSLVDLASKRSMEIINHLYHNWNDETDLYSINIPLSAALRPDTRILWTSIWENRWNAIFEGPDVAQLENGTEIEDGVEGSLITFRWQPFVRKHTDSRYLAKTTDKDVIEARMISVTPLRATFKEVEGLVGELSLNVNSNSNFFAITVDKHDYLYGPLVRAVKRYLPEVEVVSELPKGAKSIFHYGEYEQLDIDKLAMEPTNYFANSYIYRKGIIRKHFLAHTIHSYVVKNPTSILSKAALETFPLELDYAEFLDDALDENWELRQELEKNDRWWIVKPSMSDKGQGIRVFRTIEDLQAVFDSFDEDDTDDEGEFFDDNKIIISQLRHFIVQEYLHNPLLLPSMGNKKFHLRCYISCRGALEVYVYDRMLALFAPTSFTPLKNGAFSPTDILDLECHLTNTCLQTKTKEKDVSVTEFDRIPDLSQEQKSRIKSQIHQISHDVFLGALKVNAVNFQPLPNAFETYGVDFLVDSDLNVKLLEINAYPDFKQTGEELKGLIDELFDHTVRHLILPFFDESKSIASSENFVKVLDYTANNW
ncbi:putative tubulin--tyrosine ligase pby1 [Zygosaccharomyces mellis]|uniref:Putative tubulin--tyrosine ligase pby1 n=1 Tax=Zygosaccharomyces mellis TaxID=42258 RepID=A0A4C2E4E7_9SACH|nr:putative tubulin--tyrosine ligase pby1 [Zygosaccharomyces mellis]